MQIKGTPSLLKHVNLGNVEEYIRENKVVTKPKIALGTNLSLVTVTKLVSILESQGKIMTYGMEESTGGRPAQYYCINPENHYLIGLQYISGKFIGIIADALGQIVLKKTFAIENKEPPNLFEQICHAIDNLMSEYNHGEALAIGIGIPGVENKGILTSIPFLAEWEGFPLREKLKSRYKCSILIENDINLASIGLYKEKYEGTNQNMLLLYLDEGVGSGLMLNGSLFKGKTNFAGELGYMRINPSQENNKNVVDYGQTLENIVFEIRNRMSTNIPKDDLMNALLHILSETIINITCVINPNAIVVKSNLLDEKNIDRLSEIVSDRIGSVNTPDIILLSEMEEFYLNGVIKMCMDDINHSIKIYR